MQNSLMPSFVFLVSRKIDSANQGIYNVYHLTGISWHIHDLIPHAHALDVLTVVTEFLLFWYSSYPALLAWSK
jgi:hypothetical protein